MTLLQGMGYLEIVKGGGIYHECRVAMNMMNEQLQIVD
jgi:hypothetical protein